MTDGGRPRPRERPMERGQFEEESKEFPQRRQRCSHSPNDAFRLLSVYLWSAACRKWEPIQREEEEMSREWMEKIWDGQAFKSLNSQCQ